MVTLGGIESAGRDSVSTPTWTRTIIANDLPVRAVVVNVADSSATVTTAMSSQLPQALSARPTIATVWFGTGDALAGTPIETYTDDLRTIVSRLQQTGAKVLVIVGSIGARWQHQHRRPGAEAIPNGTPGGNGDRPAPDFAQYTDASRSVAQELGAEEVALPTDLRFHDAGQRSIATTVAKAIGPVR